MLCPYCQTEQKQKKYCSFCEADLTQDRPKIKQYLSEDEAYQKQPVLATYHTYDLLRMLQFLRQERTDSYKQMQIVRKTPESVSVPSDINSFAQQQYREQTDRMKIIECILIDRLGYKPKRVDNKLLNDLKAKIERGNTHENNN